MLDPQSQTIGELLKRNARDPEWLSASRTHESELATMNGSAKEQSVSYYDQIASLGTDSVVRVEAIRRSADLRVAAFDSGDAGSEKELHGAIRSYLYILEQHPNYPGIPLTLYQLARAFQLAGDDSSAINTLLRLGNEHVGSRHAADALFRAGELLFMHKRYAESGEAYRGVLELEADFKYRFVAQYKQSLANYYLGNYPEAVQESLLLLTALSPGDSVDDLDVWLASITGEQRELARNSLRLLCAALTADGNATQVAERISALPEVSYFTLIYDGVASYYLDRQRYFDAAVVMQAFVDVHPEHRLAEKYAVRSIDAYGLGGFSDVAIQARQGYLQRFGYESGRWAAAEMPENISSRVFHYLGDIASYTHAAAQRHAEAVSAERREKFLAAAVWYEKLLRYYPDAEDRAETHLFYADTLFDGGELLRSAEEYTLVAYSYPDFPKADFSALAAIKAYRILAGGLHGSDRQSALQQSVAAAERFAANFPDHREKGHVLLLAAEDYFALNEYAEVVRVVEELIANDENLAATALEKAYGLVADSQYALQQYELAEQAYLRLLGQLTSNSPLYLPARERRADSLYKLAQAARGADEHRLAADYFLEASAAATTEPMKVSTRFDAGVELYAMPDWQGSITVLESLRKEFPGNEYDADADKLLAVAYSKEGRLADAGKSYLRISTRSEEAETVRRAALKLAGELFDKVGMKKDAVSAYEAYASQFPLPLLDAQRVRLRLAELSRSYFKDSSREESWLAAIVTADKQAGDHSVTEARQMAAQASLDMALLSVHRAKAIAIRPPLEKTLARRQRATEAAIERLEAAAAYGYAEIVASATHQLGELYLSMASALLDSPAPRGIADDVREQYLLLLEEEAYPFEEKAIEAFEMNLSRVAEGLWRGGVEQSFASLKKIFPAKYGKQMLVEDFYEPLF